MEWIPGALVLMILAAVLGAQRGRIDAYERALRAIAGGAPYPAQLARHVLGFKD